MINCVQVVKLGLDNLLGQFTKQCKSFHLAAVQLAYHTLAQLVRMLLVVLLLQFTSIFCGSRPCSSFLKKKSLCWAFLSRREVLEVHAYMSLVVLTYRLCRTSHPFYCFYTYLEGKIFYYSHCMHSQSNHGQSTGLRFAL